MAPQIVPFTVEKTAIEGLLSITLKQVIEDRGVVREFFRTSAFAEAGIPIGPWLQVNVTETRQGAIRGLHAEAMTKLVAVASGEALGAYVDLRSKSPTRGKLVTIKLTPGVQVLVPQGVANGFQSVSEGVSQYLYCFSAEWVPGMPGKAVNPLDLKLNIPWPISITSSDPQLISPKDLAAPSLEQALLA